MLTLRPLTPADLEEVWRWAADPLFTRYLTWQSYTTKTALHSHLSEAQFKKGCPDQMFGISYHGQLIGSIHAIARDSHNIQFGYGIVQSYWGQGLAVKACTLALKEVVDHWPGTHFWADIHQQNIRGQRVALKLGFQLAQRNIEPLRDRYILAYKDIER